MEKRGSTNESDVRKLIKQADSEEKVIVLNMDGFRKQSNSNKDKAGIIIIATGDRATALKKVMDEILD